MKMVTVLKGMVPVIAATSWACRCWWHGLGLEPQRISHRTSHYDIVPTLMRRMLACDNAFSDYSSGQDLYDGPQWDWLVAGSYYNYAVLEPRADNSDFSERDVRGS